MLFRRMSLEKKELFLVEFHSLAMLDILTLMPSRETLMSLNRNQALELRSRMLSER
jgi:hypothetical protein